MSSPWEKIVPKVPNINLADIMSEEYAYEMKKRDGKKKLRQKNTTRIIEKDPDEQEKCPASGSGLVKCSFAETLKTPLSSNDDDGDGEWEDYSHLLDEAEASTAPEDNQSVAVDIPSVTVDAVCESDAVIAQLMQSEFDHEYNEVVKRIEKKRNQGSKVSISYDNFLIGGGGGVESPVDEYNDDEYEDSEKRDWDRFETNEKLFGTIPKCGFKVAKDGEMITKHDDQICGVRNACKVMSFPPEFPTGDGAGFAMKLSNGVFNQLRAYSKKTKKTKMHNRKENISTAEMGVDALTCNLLYKLIANQILTGVNGIVSTGKEAVILHGFPDPNYDGELVLPRECAVKVFKTTLNEFKQRDRYIKDDYRFKDRFKKQNNRVIINLWAEKEMHNMKRMRDAGINCPDVVILKKHILIMSFIGNNQLAAPKLKDARLSDADLSVAYEEVVTMMHKMYNIANLVHADLSEYNILWFEGKCWFIDVAQSIEPSHPSALEFLLRDCDNVTSFFRKRGLPHIYTKERLFKYITSLDVDEQNTATLERIHNRGASIKEATAPNQERIPDEFKPITFPFDAAWEQSMKERKSSAKVECKNKTPEVEVIDALNVLSVKCGDAEAAAGPEGFHDN